VQPCPFVGGTLPFQRREFGSHKKHINLHVFLSINIKAIHVQANTDLACNFYPGVISSVKHLLMSLRSAWTKRGCTDSGISLREQAKCASLKRQVKAITMSNIF